MVQFFNLMLLCISLFLCFSCNVSNDKNTNELSIKKSNPIREEAVVDLAGNEYPVVKIGDQIWMSENLRLTKTECYDAVEMQFTSGIEKGPDVKFYDGQARFAYYNNDPQLGLGVIYSYKAVKNCKLCPTGFRIPTKTDFEQLSRTLGGTIAAGKAMLKKGGSGFNAEIGGRIDSYGSVMAGSFGFWWTSDKVSTFGDPEKVYIFELTNDGVIKILPQDYRIGNYVRCIKE